ncbi:MAG: hypothetical protein J6A77_06135 [Lachnospiraceae bacterium]|nr:hypothetical protein [Lachnospiraceae bacterium]
MTRQRSLLLLDGCDISEFSAVLPLKIPGVAYHKTLKPYYLLATRFQINSILNCFQLPHR